MKSARKFRFELFSYDGPPVLFVCDASIYPTPAHAIQMCNLECEYFIGPTEADVTYDWAAWRVDGSTALDPEHPGAYALVDRAASGAFKVWAVKLNEREHICK
jgi:hypothetical protein